MDIYLTNLKTKDRLRFPMLPTEISVNKGNKFASYSIIDIGEVKIPSGTSLDGFSWNGIFPGKPRKRDPYVRTWQDPKAIYKWIDKLKSQRGKPVKARLLITETPINCDVYLNSFTGTPTGGYGDINYSISLIQAKEIKLSPSATATNQANSQEKIAERTSPPAAQTCTVVAGDCLWNLAQKYLGNGADYKKFYEANKEVIDAHKGGPNMIWPGDVLKIPT